MMTTLLLLLASCFCLGLSCDTVQYGNSCKLRVSRRAQSIVFSPSHNSDKQILWRRDDLSPRNDSRRKLVGLFFEMYNLTEKDSGYYKTMDKDQMMMSLERLRVTAHRKYLERTAGESFEFTFNLEPSSCNINFTQYDTETKVVVRGELHEDSYASNCRRFEVLKPCGILKQNLEPSCSGKFRVKDADDNLALVVSLNVEPIPPTRTPEEDPDVDIAIGFGFIVLGILCTCCTCLIHFNKKCSNKQTTPESVVQYQEYESEPAVLRRERPNAAPTYAPTRPLIHNPLTTSEPAAYSKYEREPAALRREQPSAAPTSAPTGPLIHNPLTTSEPAAYSEVSPRADQADVPPAPFHSEPEHRFAVKGLTFPSAFPLDSDSTCTDVYTSDKLNFL